MQMSGLIADDNRDLNDHPEDDLKRQRSNYNGDQLYSNVRIYEFHIYIYVSKFSSLAPYIHLTVVKLRLKLSQRSKKESGK